FALQPNQLLLVDNLARAIIGDSRESRFAELHNLQIDFSVVAGEGAVTPFAISIDNASADPSLRLE
ncbi:MAG TPA: hypothetical protein VIL97_09955, partial [Thermoanaerobaculia bacterium]